MKTCNTCGRNADSPWRIYDDKGHVIHGCVDAHHNGRLIPFSESAHWHARPEAERIRAALAKRAGA